MKWLSEDTKGSATKGKSSKKTSLTEEALVGKEEKEELGVIYEEKEVQRISAALTANCVVKSFRKEKKVPQMRIDTYSE